MLQRLEACLTLSHPGIAVPPAFQSSVLPELGPSMSSPCSSLSMPHYQASGGIKHIAGMPQSLHVNPSKADFADKEGNHESMSSGFSIPQIDMLVHVYDPMAFGLVRL